MARFNPTTLVPDIEDSLLTIQKKALLKRAYQRVNWLASASRTTTTSTGALSNPGYKGIMVTLVVSSITAGGLKIRILTGVGGGQTVHIDATSITSVGGRTVAVYPGGGTGGNQVCQPALLGDQVIINVEHDTADPITYSAQYHFVE